jgi:hypothetical protein
MEERLKQRVEKLFAKAEGESVPRQTGWWRTRIDCRQSETPNVVQELSGRADESRLPRSVIAVLIKGVAKQSDAKRDRTFLVALPPVVADEYGSAGGVEFSIAILLANTDALSLSFSPSAAGQFLLTVVRASFRNGTFGLYRKEWAHG